MFQKWAVNFLALFIVPVIYIPYKLANHTGTALVTRRIVMFSTLPSTVTTTTSVAYVARNIGDGGLKRHASTSPEHFQPDQSRLRVFSPSSDICSTLGTTTLSSETSTMSSQSVVSPIMSSIASMTSIHPMIVPPFDINAVDSESSNTDSMTDSNPTINSVMTSVMPRIQSAIEPLVQSVVSLQINQHVQAAVAPLWKSIDTQNRQIHEMYERMSYLEESVHTLRSANNQLEQYGRRNSLRIDNVSISNPDDFDSDKIMVDLINSKLEPSPPISVDDIERSHPLGPVRRGPGNRFIVKFRTYKVRTRVISNRNKLKGTKIFVSEDLTRQNHLLYTHLRAAVRDRRIHATWSYDGKLFYRERERGRKIRVLDEDDVAKFL